MGKTLEAEKSLGLWFRGY